MAVTIRDVAKLAGVSASTVSRTCNNHPSISDETKEKVKAAMEQLGYTPSTNNAKSANAKKNVVSNIKHMGIILPPSNITNYENSFNLRALRGISLYCTKHGYSNSIITGENRHNLLDNVKIMVDNQDVAGFIVLYTSPSDPLIEYLHDNKVPYVMVGKSDTYSQTTIYVDNDNLIAGQDATEYLFKLNHEQIGFIGYDSKMLFSYERQSGYTLCMMQHGITVPPEYIITDNEPPLTEECSVARLLKSPNRPTAFVVADDTLAVAVLQLCFRLGLNVPNDISIMSFNNSLVSLLTYPQLTSIDINSIQLGEAAAAQLAERIESTSETLAAKIIVPHSLIERQSCTWCDR